MFARTLAIAALTLLGSATSIRAAEPLRTVHVEGNGVVRVTPDRVVIGVSLTTIDDDLVRVRDSSDNDARGLLALAKKHGVEDAGFEVSQLSISFHYNDQLRRNIYQVDRSTSLRLDDLPKLNGLVSDLLKEKSYRVSGITFTSSKAKQHELEARAKAMADAKEKAKHLAELSDLKLGKARGVRISSERYVPFASPVAPSAPAPAALPAIRPQLLLDPAKGFVAFHAEGDADKKPFALGAIEVTANVEVEFELTE